MTLRHETVHLLVKLKSQRVKESVCENPWWFYWSCDKWFGRLVRAVGLDPRTFHDLRKNCNTLMKDAGVSPEAAIQVLGHTTAKVKREHYTGTLIQQQRFVVDAIPSAG